MSTFAELFREKQEKTAKIKNKIQLEEKVPILPSSVKLCGLQLVEPGPRCSRPRRRSGVEMGRIEAILDKGQVKERKKKSKRNESGREKKGRNKVSDASSMETSLGMLFRMIFECFFDSLSAS